MSGIIKGKEAYNYEKSAFMPEKEKRNTFLSRVVKPNKIILDMCCGTGICIEFLRKNAKKIYGIDASEDMIEICKKRFSINENKRQYNKRYKKQNIELYVRNAESTNFKDEFFDYVIMRMALHHIKDKKAVICECWRILKNKGILIIMDKFPAKSILYAGIYEFIKNPFRKFSHYYIRMEELSKITKKKFKIKYVHQQRKGIFIKANIIFEKI